MTTERNIIIHAGQTFELSLDYAGTPGRGQRMHIRAADEASTVIAILTHNGDANARVIYDGSDSIDVTIGASVSGEWLVGANRVEWVYDIEDYDLSDADDVVITHRGKVIVYGNRTRPAEIDPAPTPNSNAPFVRWDIAQTLTDEEKEQARDNIGAGTGGGGGSVEWGDVTGTLADQTDLNSALSAKAPLASPTFTGTPAAPTAAGGTSTTQIATTAFVGSAVSTHAGATDPHGDRAYADGLAANYATAAQGALADSAVQDIAAEIHAATEASIADADEMGFWRLASSALRKITWANIKATLKTYFDTLYAATSRTISGGGLVTGGGDLSANRTLTVTGASTATTEAWSSTSEALTPGGLKNAAPPYVEWGVSADKTLALTDANVDQWCNNSSTARVLNIPTNASVAFSVGAQIPGIRLGSGTCTVDAPTGVTLNGVDGGSCTVSTQGQGFLLTKTGTNAWWITGDRSAVA